MKIKFMATLVAAFAAGFQTLAAISSLPIGSVERVLNHELQNTHRVTVNIKAAGDNSWQSATFLFMKSWRSYTKADGTTESINALCQRAVATGDKTELKTLLQTMMREAVRVSVDPNDPALQGKPMQVLVTGEWQPDLTKHLQSVGTFAIDNEFVLGELKDSQGNTVIPDSAYETDMDQAITHRIEQGFWIDGAVKAEIRDQQGNLLETDVPLSWITIAQVIVISNAYVFGQQPGVMQLWYTDGTTQVFNLADGSLLSPTVKIEPVATGGISAKSAVPSGPIRITVSGPPGLLTVEYSENLKDWQVLTVLTNSLYGFVSTVDEATSAKGARFYRARLGN